MNNPPPAGRPLLLTRRRLLQAAIVAGGGLGVAVTGCSLHTTAMSPWDPSVLDHPVFGMLEANPEQYHTLAEAGLTAVSLSVDWKRAEPHGPGLDEGYLREIEDRHRAASGAGLHLALDTGLQYPPSWVFDLPGGTRFVDQDGAPWRGGPGDDVADAVFNHNVRAAQDAYLQRLAARVADLPVAGIRVGGLGRGELHYPPMRQKEPGTTFWAFGPAALASSPVPEFYPGKGTQQEAATFLEWYLESLARYGRWQLDTYRRYFGSAPRLLVLQPSWGVRPGEIELAIEGRLGGASRGERRGTLCEGLDWERQLRSFSEIKGAAVCTTWLDPPDQGADAGSTSPGVYLAALAGRHNVGVWAENTGNNSADDMRRCFERVGHLNLGGLFWMSGSDLGQRGNASLQDYAQLIAANKGERPSHGR